MVVNVDMIVVVIVMNMSRPIIAIVLPVACAGFDVGTLTSNDARARARVTYGSRKSGPVDRTLLSTKDVMGTLRTVTVGISREYTSALHKERGDLHKQPGRQHQHEDPDQITITLKGV